MVDIILNKDLSLNQVIYTYMYKEDNWRGYGIDEMVLISEEYNEENMEIYMSKNYDGEEI